MDEGVLQYEDYYKLLESEDGIEILNVLQLPIQSEDVKGELSLKSLADEGELNLRLKTSEGQKKP